VIPEYGGTATQYILFPMNFYAQKITALETLQGWVVIKG
jgi:hypothetical protein